MNRKSQVISIFFAVFLIIAVLSIIGLESANLKTNENISQIETAYTLTDNAYQSISNVYSTAYNLGLSPQAISFLQSSVAAIADTYMINYHLNLSEGIALTNPSTSLQPTSFVEKVPVTITNLQNAGVAPFQQMINFTSSDPGWSYMNTSAVGFGQNVEFLYSNGQVIPSWLESYNPTDGVWWIKLGSMPPSSSTTIYMGFAPQTTNLFNNVNDGEAPTLSEIVQSNGIEYAAPITIANSQSSATPSPFQQMLNISSSVYSSYAASNLQNVEFLYKNGTVIPSWLEQYTSSYAIWWVKLGSIPAGGNVKVYMGFASTSTNLFNTNDVGEAPTLSSSYGEYDDGANVFKLYTNFAGTSVPSGFTEYHSSDSSISVNNGITFNIGDSDNPAYAFILYGSNFPDSVVDAEITSIPVAQDGSTEYPGFTSSTIGNGMANYVGFEWYETCGYVYHGDEIYNVSEISSNTGGLNAHTIMSSSNAFITGYYNYSTILSSTDTATPADTYPVLGVQTAGSSSGCPDTEAASYQWYDVRAEPPNGVMPSISVGAVASNGYYAEYDDGANVFSNYWNFAGASLPSGWNSTETASLAVNNGVSFTGASGGGNAAQIVYTTAINPPFVLEYDAYSSGNNPAGDLAYVNQYGSAFSNGYQALFSNGGTSTDINYWSSGSITTEASTSAGPSVSQIESYAPMSLGVGPNIVWGMWNYQYYISWSATPTTGYYIALGSWWDDKTIHIQWARVRAYPPNGVMPSVSFG